MLPVTTPPTRTWRLLPEDVKAAQRLARSAGVPPLVARLLLNRGVAPRQARRFLEASHADLHAPGLLPGADQAAERILHAVRAGWRIHVWGDYDVDGMTGSAIMLMVLRALGARARIYVPDRLTEGYGLNTRALRKIAESGGRMVITVDCGIASLAEA